MQISYRSMGRLKNTLIVDSTAKPIGLTTVQEAVSRMARATIESERSAQALVVDPGVRFRSNYLDLPMPVVLMTESYIEIPQVDLARVNRRVVFARDRYECQYCTFVAHSGRSRQQLTLDHVKPARLFDNKAEATTYENVTTACFHCNQRKADRLPMECGMMPRRTPVVPHYAQLRFAGRLDDRQRDYVADYFGWSSAEIGL